MASLFRTQKPSKVEATEDPAFELRQRLLGRGGEESTRLTGGRGVTKRSPIFTRLSQKTRLGE